jgi:hypothetical protein
LMGKYLDVLYARREGSSERRGDPRWPKLKLGLGVFARND